MKCPYVQMVPQPLKYFENKDCSIVESNGTVLTKIIDESGFCKRCEDVLPFCSECENDEDGNFICLSCKQNIEIYAPYIQALTQDQSCQIPHCTQTSPTSNQCIQCHSSRSLVGPEGICVLDCAAYNTIYAGSVSSPCTFTACPDGMTPNRT